MSEIHGKKKALGRGLSALLDNQESDVTHEISSDYPAGSVNHIPIAYIEPNPFQPRTHFNETELAELAVSIVEQGIIQPLTLRKVGHDKYQIIAGERRWKASKIAGLTEVPAYVRVANDEQMLEMALVENIQRAELNPLEIAISFQRLLEECKIKQEELSQKVGKDRSTISNYIRLLKLPAEIQLAVRDSMITMGHARAIINIGDEQSQLIALQHILENKLSVRQVEEMVRDLTSPKTEKRPATSSNPAILPQRFAIAKDNLSSLLRLPVEVKINHKGKGSIIINFKSDEDFDRIVSKLES